MEVTGEKSNDQQRITEKEEELNHLEKEFSDTFEKNSKGNTMENEQLKKRLREGLNVIKNELSPMEGISEPGANERESGGEGKEGGNGQGGDGNTSDGEEIKLERIVVEGNQSEGAKKGEVDSGDPSTLYKHEDQDNSMENNNGKKLYEQLKCDLSKIFKQVLDDVEQKILILEKDIIETIKNLQRDTQEENEDGLIEIAKRWNKLVEDTKVVVGGTVGGSNATTGSTGGGQEGSGAVNGNTRNGKKNQRKKGGKKRSASKKKKPESSKNRR